MKLSLTNALLAFVFLILTAHRLPAPISEESPAPTAKGSTKAKHIRVSEAPTNAEKTKGPQESAPKTLSATRSKFAGTWVGTIQTFPPGPTETALTVDPTEAIMRLSWKLSNTRLAEAKHMGDTIQATFEAGLGTATFYITPLSDGRTARVRMTAFMNDFTAIFQRTVTESTPTR